MRVWWAGRGTAACLLVSGVLGAVLLAQGCGTPDREPDPGSLFVAGATSTAGAAGMADARPPPMVIDKECQPYGLHLATCGNCPTKFSCNCSRGGIYESGVPECSMWGLCVLSYDCTTVCGLPNPADAYLAISTCLGTRACQTDSECPHGFCAAGACSVGALGNPCAEAADCVSGYCGGGRCSSGAVRDYCTSKADCASRICVPGLTPELGSTCQLGQNESPCMNDADCVARKCITETIKRASSPDTLVHECSDGAHYAPCGGDADCADGGVCLTLANGSANCFVGAVSDPCRDARDCKTSFCDETNADAGVSAGLGRCAAAP